MWMLAGRPLSGSKAWNSSQSVSNFSIPSLLSNNWIRRAPALERSSVFDISDFCWSFRRRKGVNDSSPFAIISFELTLLLCLGDWLGVDDFEEWDRLGDSRSAEVGSSSMLDDFPGLCFQPQFFHRCFFDKFMSNFFWPFGVAEADEFPDCSPPAKLSSSIIESFLIISSCVDCKCFKSTISKSSKWRYQQLMFSYFLIFF